MVQEATLWIPQNNIMKFIISTLLTVTHTLGDDHNQCYAPNIEVPNARWNGRRRIYQYGMTISYRCDFGYSTNWKDPPTATCTGDNIWDIDNKDNCQPVNCGYPPDILNGYYVSEGGFTVAQEVDYYCEKGFRPEGETTAMCMADGKWSFSVQPSCKAEECAIIETVRNGHLTDIEVHRTTNLNRASALLVCDKFHSIHGGTEKQAYRNCVNGQWDGVLACQEISCPLEEPKNGYIEGMPRGRSSLTKTHEMILYSCDVGYMLQGEDYNMCIGRDQWLNEIPSCQPIKCRLSLSRHLNVNTTEDYVAFGNSVRFSCGEGYSLDGVEQTRCNEHGRLDHDIPSCKRMCELEEHKNTVYEREAGDVILTDHVKDGTLVVVDCTNDYVRKDNDGFHMAVCENGRWKGVNSNGEVSDEIYDQLFYCKKESWFCDKFGWGC